MTLPLPPFVFSPPGLVPPSTLTDRGMKVFDEVKARIKARVGSVFVMRGGWPWTDEGMHQFVRMFCNRWAEVVHEHAQARRFLSSPPRRPDLDDEQFEVELAAYLISISHYPFLDFVPQSDDRPDGHSRPNRW